MERSHNRFSVSLRTQHRKTHSASGSGEPSWGESTLHKVKLLAVVIQTFETNAHVFRTTGIIRQRDGKRESSYGQRVVER